MIYTVLFSISAGLDWGWWAMSAMLSVVALWTVSIVGMVLAILWYPWLSRILYVFISILMSMPMHPNIFHPGSLIVRNNFKLFPALHWIFIQTLIQHIIATFFILSLELIRHRIAYIFLIIVHILQHLAASTIIRTGEIIHIQFFSKYILELLKSRSILR